LGRLSRLRRLFVPSLLCGCLSGGLAFGPIQSTAAQEPALPPKAPAATPQTAQDDSQVSASAADSSAAKQERGSLVVAPLPIVSPAIGNGIVPVVAYIFPFTKKDKISPPSVIAAAGLFTDNGSRAGAVGADLFMKENRYELMSFYLYGKLDYNLGVELCIDNLNQVALIVASHNEYSNLYATELLKKKGLPFNHPHIHFSQLYGMSDNITFNLAKAGCSVSKYLPFGPIKDVIPYLMRRAQENSSVAGQTGRELGLIKKELKRRGL